MYKQIEVKLSSLIPYANNTRTHTEQQVKQVAASIKEFGFTNPVLIDSSNMIIAGHCRVVAAGLLGMEKVPCIVLGGLTEAQKKAYIIADNQLALNAGWDLDLLSVELLGLKDLDFDLSLIGFDDDVIIDLLGAVEEVGLPELADGDKEPFQQKTFTLHDEQADVVSDAVTLARTSPLADTGINENSNGNALSLICDQWLKAQNGHS